MSSQLILTVTPNPALDSSYFLPEVVRGASHRVPPATSRAGGKGLNVSRVAHQQGYQTLALAPVGGPDGGAFRAELLNSGVPHELLSVPVQTRRSMAFVEQGTGEATIFNESGHPLPPESWHAVFEALARRLPEAAVVVGAGSLPPQTPEHFYPRMVSMAHEAGIPAVVDTSGAGLLAAARAGADLLKPNAVEVQQALGLSEPGQGAQALLALGARAVLLSAGADGMSLYSAQTPGEIWTARFPRALQGNPTGAGDAVVSAVASCIVEGIAEPAALLRRAVAWSAAAVLSPLAGELAEGWKDLETQVAVSRSETR